MNGRKQGARFLKYRRSIDRRSDLARPSATPDQGRGLGAGRGGKIGIGKSVKRSAPEEVTWLFMGTAALSRVAGQDAVTEASSVRYYQLQSPSQSGSSD